MVRRAAACVLLVCQCASVDRWQPTAYWTTCDGEGSGRSSRLRSEHSKGRTPPPHGRHHKADTWHTVTAAITAVAVPAANAAAISATAITAAICLTAADDADGLAPYAAHRDPLSR